ncbi:uncharacterized protein LOC143182926 [Calliopsis andreniformis]|uniref:uncharacterized protein LOC143182926 n=1 Tax=Calliopsis andreniformis TaxID=337506 RepID=UPI003FCDF5B6
MATPSIGRRNAHSDTSSRKLVANRACLYFRKGRTRVCQREQVRRARGFQCGFDFSRTGSRSACLRRATPNPLITPRRITDKKRIGNGTFERQQASYSNGDKFVMKQCRLINKSRLS